jgi:hypothetical protein
VIIFLGVLIGILFLEETHVEKKYRQDPSLEAGKWILSTVSRCAKSKSLRNEKVADLDNIISLLSEDGQPPGYHTTEGSQNLPSTPSPEPREALNLNDVNISPISKPAATKAFTRHVVLNIVGYGILA